jgi:DNA polymerase-4
MPLRTAARRLPEGAVFLPADHTAYDEASADVMATLRSWVDRDPGVGGARVTALEVLGWDEAFLGAAAAAPQPGDPEPLARALQHAVLERTALHCSLGIGDNKLQAKTATGFGKPRGIGRISSEQWLQVMGERPVTALWGIGTKTAKRLDDLGITTVHALAAADTATLAARLGPTMGPWYRRLGRGVDSSAVDPTPWVPKAHGRETTFQRDLEDWQEVAEEVRRLAARVAEDIAAEGRPAARVGVKVRYTPFETRQRSLTLPEPSGDADVLGDAAVTLVGRFDTTRRVRLVGVRAEMTPPSRRS